MFVFSDISIIDIIFIEGELRDIRELCKEGGRGAKFGQFVVLFSLEENEHFLRSFFQQV